MLGVVGHRGAFFFSHHHRRRAASAWRNAAATPDHADVHRAAAGASVHRTKEHAFPDACWTSVHRSNAPRGFLRIISSHLAASWLLSARLNSPSRPADFSASVQLPHEEYRTGRLGLTGEVRPVVVIELNCVCRSFMPVHPAAPSRPSGRAHRNLR
jgi:hypothetical protein